MATTIITKYGSGAPTASDVVRGELAVDTENGRLYTETSGGAVIEIGTNPAANVTFGDNGKAIFGAGSDLQIYHVGGSASYVETATNDLYLKGFRDVYLQASGANSLTAIGGGATTLLHNGSAKIATTSTGIDVTGTVTADGLRVDGTPVRFVSTAPMLNFMESGVTDSNHRLRQNAGNFVIQKLSDDEGTATDRFLIDGGTGDISFYEDTGTNPKLVWKASDERLGIGTASPAAILDCRENSTGGSTQIRVYNTDNSNTTTQTAALFLSPDSRGNGALIHAEKENADFSTSAGRDVSLVFSPVLNNTQTRAMTLDSSGNLLVGETNTAPGAGNTVTGVAIRGGSDNRSFFSVSSNYVAAFNRNTNDGPIVEFNRDGAGVGSIASTDGTDLQIGSGNCYLRFDDATNQILPTNAAGTKRDATLDLGDSDARYKDLHASGRGFFNLYSASIADGNIMVGEGVYVGSTSGDNQIRSSSAGAGSATLYIGNAAIQVSSDQRLKTNIVDTEMNATDKLNQVRVVDFNWDDPSDTSFNNRNARGKWTGVLAQELVDVLPFAVNAPRNEEDLTIDAESDQKWLVDQAQMVPVLIKAIQELTARIATLEGAN